MTWSPAREARHLAARFVGSVFSRGPDPADEAWLLDLLGEEEARLYAAQSGPDRAHSVDCALVARRILGARATIPVIVASALHDVGKAEAGLGTLGRVAATVAGRAVGDERIDAWRAAEGARGRIGRYLRHDRRGAELLEAAGSHPMVVTWARQHHLDAGEWTLDAEVAEALAAADHEVRPRRRRRRSTGGEEPDVGLGPGQCG